MQQVASAHEPVVSVVTPAYNAATYLAETVESVLAQTLREFELILVDDGSTDQTPDILESYAADPRVRMILSTGYVEPKRLNDLLQQGVDAVLRKPYRTEVFAATVRRVLALPRP